MEGRDTRNNGMRGAVDTAIMPSAVLSIETASRVPLVHIHVRVQQSLLCFTFCIGAFTTGWRIKQREGDCHLWRIKRSEGDRHLWRIKRREGDHHLQLYAQIAIEMR